MALKEGKYTSSFCIPKSIQIFDCFLLDNHIKTIGCHLPSLTDYKDIIHIL